MNEDSRRIVLARRARFVALALAGLTPGCRESVPAESEPGPREEILVEVPEAKSSKDDSDAAPPGRSDAGVAAPPSEVVPPPQICLSY